MYRVKQITKRALQYFVHYKYTFLAVQNTSFMQIRPIKKADSIPTAVPRVSKHIDPGKHSLGHFISQGPR